MWQATNRPGSSCDNIGIYDGLAAVSLILGGILIMTTISEMVGEIASVGLIRNTDTFGTVYGMAGSHFYMWDFWEYSCYMNCWSEPEDAWLTFYIFNHCVRQAGAGGWSWSGVREKYCYLAGGWRLVLERCEREIL